MTRKVTRRTFLSTASALTVAASASFSPAYGQASTADQLIAGKDKRLLVLKPFPAVLETPLPLLTEQRITPSSLLFVRNNQQPESAATVQPATEKQWALKLTGDLNQSVAVSLQQLQAMDMTEYEMVLQCSGNGRSLYSKAAQTSGTQWGRGGVGNVKFKGVLLSTLFDKLGLEPGSGVQYVDASGVDEPLPGKEDFLHSLPVGDVMNRSILALEMNGKPLPAIHGGPVRLITPGVYATMNVKWLGELNFVSQESTNYNHVPRYRVPDGNINPGDEYDFTLQNSRFNWSLNTKSILLTPTEGDQISAGPTTIKGVAFNDGRASITAVYLSTDKGQSWIQAQLRPASSLYAWTQFQQTLDLKRGAQEIWCRAIDEYGRTQPDNGSITWNPRGYEWNGIEKIPVVCG